MAGSIQHLPENTSFFRIMDRGESTLLCLLLIAMIGLACTQITLRTFFSGGFVWADPLLRYLVLWSGLLGAVKATGTGQHIAIDIFGGRLPRGLLPLITLISHLFCSVTAGGLTWAGWLFLISEYEYGGLGPLSLPFWIWNGIFPVSFGLITLKYLVLTLFQIREIFSIGN